MFGDRSNQGRSRYARPSVLARAGSPCSVGVVVTCEHGGNYVPPRYRSLFRGHETLLESHRGWDPGALEIARALADRFEAPLIFSTTTRLLVELNRPLLHSALFSSITRDLDREERQRIIAEHYKPHRLRIEETIRRLIDEGRSVIHLAAHTFTPVLDGEVRNADVGLLYHSARPLERDFCIRWKRNLKAVDPLLRIRRNYPYQGVTDGLATYLRRVFPQRVYLGIEIEVNQKHALGPRPAWQRLTVALADACHTTLFGGGACTAEQSMLTPLRRKHRP